MQARRDKFQANEIVGIRGKETHFSGSHGHHCKALRQVVAKHFSNGCCTGAPIFVRVMVKVIIWSDHTKNLKYQPQIQLLLVNSKTMEKRNVNQFLATPFACEL